MAELLAAAVAVAVLLYLTVESSGERGPDDGLANNSTNQDREVQDETAQGLFRKVYEDPISVEKKESTVVPANDGDFQSKSGETVETDVANGFLANSAPELEYSQLSLAARRSYSNSAFLKDSAYKDFNSRTNRDAVLTVRSKRMNRAQLTFEEK